MTRDSKLDEESLFFNILKKPDSEWISPDDFLPVLEGIHDMKCKKSHTPILKVFTLKNADVVSNHPGLMFLGDNAMFQERYSKFEEEIVALLKLFYCCNKLY